jgi:DNA-binding MarR family transcriptional regulator
MRLVSRQSLPNGSIDNLWIDDLARLARDVTRGLEVLREEIRVSMEEIPTVLPDIPAGIDVRLDVRSARKLRRLRKKLFGNDLHWGPAWDILLHLFESHVLQRKDTIGNVADGSELPGTTALRWIARLQQEGLIRLHDDHLDRRRRYVSLSLRGVERMSQYFTGAAPHLIAA